MQNESRTARMVAALRARATAREHALCDDPWADALAGREGFAWADAYEKTVPHVETWVALRTARIDDVVVRALAAGVEQVVVLGAGFDTRSARLARPGARFFEVDHPESQRDKIARLAGLSDYPREAATYVPCDFERDELLGQLIDAGFRTDAPALFVWEGVTYYLSEGAVRATLTRLASGTHPRSFVVFDYFGRRFVAGEVKSELDRAARDRIADMGEPMLFGIDDLVPLLYATGFRKVHVESFDAIALNRTGTYERERKFRFQSLAFASVARELP